MHILLPKPILGAVGLGYTVIVLSVAVVEQPD